MLYGMPALTGIKIEPETIATLSQHPNIIGRRGQLKRTWLGSRELVKLCPSDFAVMTGNGTVFLDALKLGATGAILAVGCAVPEVCVEIFQSFRSGDIARAETLQAKLTLLAAAVTTRFGIGGLKAAMRPSWLSRREMVVRRCKVPNELNSAQRLSELFRTSAGQWLKSKTPNSVISRKSIAS